MDYILSNTKVIYKDSNVDVEKIHREVYQRQRARQLRTTGLKLAANIVLESKKFL